MSTPLDKKPVAECIEAMLNSNLIISDLMLNYANYSHSSLLVIDVIAGKVFNIDSCETDVEPLQTIFDNLTREIVLFSE